MTNENDLNPKGLFKERLLEAMKNAGMNQAELAMEINLSPASISRYLSGEMIPRFPVASRIADALGVTTEWILGFSDETVTANSKKVTMKCPFLIFTSTEVAFSSTKTHRHFEDCYKEKCPYYDEGNEGQGYCRKVEKECEK